MTLNHYRRLTFKHSYYGGAYSAPPDLLAELKGPTSKGRGGGGVEKEGKGREGGEAYEP